MSKNKSPKPAAKAVPTDKEIAARNAAALARVATMDDPDGLRNLIANAERMGVAPVRDAAFRRLARVQSEGEDGSVEHDAWQMVHAVEQVKREAAGKTIRLSYFRREMLKIGAAPAIGKLVLKAGPSERFDELLERGHPELTAEALVLRHPEVFGDDVRAAAKARLTGADVDLAALAPAAG